MAAWVERRLENAPEFSLGLLIGETSVLATAFLICLVLLWGGEEDWHALALLVFVVHLPIAVIEGIILGFTVGFLAKVKPEMLGWTQSREHQEPMGPWQSNGVAHAQTHDATQRTEEPACQADQQR
jgi:hypothetical protein